MFYKCGNGPGPIHGLADLDIGGLAVWLLWPRAIAPEARPRGSGRGVGRAGHDTRVFGEWPGPSD